VMLRKPPAARSIGVEIDRRTIDKFPMPEGVEVHCGDCVAFLRTFDCAQAGRVVVYADPPYVLSTRAHAGTRYRHDYSDADHMELLATLKGLPASVKVILSGYPSELYDAELQGWRTYEFQVATRGGPRTERLWMNFEAGKLHWAAFAGMDFKERQRIKRKAERWRDSYMKLPECERLAILAALMDGAEEQEAPRYRGRNERKAERTQ